MRWLAEKGPAFHHSREKDGAILDYKHFCTANLSLKRRFMLDKGMFDEVFRQFYDDVELGFRLEQQGLQIVLDKGALGYHLRGETVQGFCVDRAKAYGRKAVSLYTKWPVLKSSMNPSSLNKRVKLIEAAKKTMLGPVIPVVLPVIRWLDSHDYDLVPSSFYMRIYQHYYQIGYKEGLKSTAK